MNKSRKTSAVLFACIFVILGMWMMLSVYCQAAETNNDEKQPQTIRVGSFEDTFNYVGKNGVRQGYGYELMQALAGYTGWKFEYVKCDWSNCFDKLENGEIDIMGDISYTDERAQKMLFPEEPMGEEKYILYADLSNLDIGTYDFKFMDGKRVGVLMDTEDWKGDQRNRDGYQHCGPVPYECRGRRSQDDKAGRTEHNGKIGGKRQRYGISRLYPQAYV